MNRGRWLVVVAAAGALIFALSFVPGWITHDRELRGEGYRHVVISLTAWRALAIPALSIGAVLALAVAAAALFSRVRPARGVERVLLPAALAVLALLGASAVPVAQDGHASSLDLRAEWLLWIGIVLAIAMVAGAAAVTRVRRRVLLGALGLTLAFGGLVVGGRWAQLQASQGTGENWTDGTYTLGGDGGAPTLTIAKGRYTLADRWSGTWESSGWTVVLVDDPACPDARGTYHAHDEGPDGTDLRFVKVVDTCGGGARAELLESGIWER